MIKAQEVRKTIGKNMLADGFNQVIDLDKSHESWFIDKSDGKEYLDFFSMFASGSVGYNHPKLVAHKDEFGRIAITKPTNSDIYSEEMAEFVDTFSKIAKPDYFKYMFFVAGGALAVENALKVAFDWKTKKNFEKGLKTEGSKIIHFKQAFHGRTGYTLSLTNTSDPRKTQYFPLFDWPRITNPKVTYPLNDENLAKVKKLEEKALSEIHDAINKNKDAIAGLILEPIQGEGGDNHFRKEFMQELRKICDEKEILFIMDEVQSGAGLTGKFWAHEHYDVKPDVISFGKKTQVCGILSSDRVDEIKDNVFHESSRINSTWGGNLIDMVRFSAILKIIEEENLVENARIQGEYLLSELQKIANDFPQLISNPRGKGLMCAFDLPDGEIRDSLLGKLSDKQLLILGCGDNSIRFRPHLVITKDEIKHGIDVIREVLESM
ncbi:MAG: L-lysine 6-transaminase [Candidatus Marinimicrobia bacterium]|nr:L-lysine 6-transaminase [Candidatus Neomarinimicrobiota bacterium]